MELQPGRRARVSLTVDDSDTAISLGSGDVPVLGTPAVLALAERAAVAAVSDDLEAQQTTVGSWAQLHHMKPSRVGAEVHAEAELTGVNGPRLEFRISVTEGDTEVARVEHRRVVVDRARFS